jgi:hypothetical protein
VTLTVTEVAAMASLAPRNVRKAIQNGKLPAELTKGHGGELWLIDAPDAAAFADAKHAQREKFAAEDITGAWPQLRAPSACASTRSFRPHTTG